MYWLTAWSLLPEPPDGLAGESIDKSKGGISFLVLDSILVPRVHNPVLAPVSKVGRHEADSAIADSDAKALTSLAVDAAGGHCVKPATGRIGLVILIENLPALGVPLGPLGEHNGGVADLHATTM